MKLTFTEWCLAINKDKLIRDEDGFFIYARDYVKKKQNIHVSEYLSDDLASIANRDIYDNADMYYPI